MRQLNFGFSFNSGIFHIVLQSRFLPFWQLKIDSFLQYYLKNLGRYFFYNLLKRKKVFLHDMQYGWTFYILSRVEVL